MKKNRTGTWIPLRNRCAKILMIMKLTFLMMCAFVFSLSAGVRAQDQMVTLKVEGMPFYQGYFRVETSDATGLLL